MFSLVEPLSVSVIDEERGLLLSPLGRYFDDPATTTWLLSVGDKKIPFDICSESGSEHNIPAKECCRFVAFGASSHAHFKGINPYKFSNDNENNEKKLLAIEGILASYWLVSRSETRDTNRAFLDDGVVYWPSEFSFYKVGVHNGCC